jgi:Na+-driven multidrug efflux pump
MAQEVLIGGGPNRAKLRNPWGVLGLLLITLGIYGIFWWYFVNREMRDYGHATGYDLGQNPANSALALFPGSLIIVPPLVSYWRGARRAQAAQRVAGVSPLSGWIALILFLLLSIAFPPYIQSELNKAWRRAGTALPGESLPPEPDEMPSRLEDPPPPPG